jgi:hypothetical protein
MNASPNLSIVKSTKELVSVERMLEATGEGAFVAHGVTQMRL